jgi:hypothetical protein
VFLSIAAAACATAAPPTAKHTAQAPVAVDIEAAGVAGAPEAAMTAPPKGVNAAPTEPVSSETHPRVAWLSARHISQAVQAQHAAFSACRTLGDADDPRRDAAVTLGWAVKANGGVRRVTIDQSTFDSTQVNDCVLSVARDVRFPASTAPTEVSWTVRFQRPAGNRLAGTDPGLQNR